MARATLLYCFEVSGVTMKPNLARATLLVFESMKMTLKSPLQKLILTYSLTSELCSIIIQISPSVRYIYQVRVHYLQTRDFFLTFQKDELSIVSKMENNILTSVIDGMT